MAVPHWRQPIHRERAPFFRMPLWVRTVLAFGILLFFAFWVFQIPFVAAALPVWLTTADLRAALLGINAAALIVGYWHAPSSAVPSEDGAGASDRSGMARTPLLVGAVLVFGAPLLGLVGLVLAALVPSLSWLGSWGGGVATLSSIINMLLLLAFGVGARDAIQQRLLLSQGADSAP